ncbi:hypothetical protein GXW82_15320 [Streptacidiphilus sp. 4-A2]|nr:hypothetical protein [Streptacidiphilus sp. 4-A2]
MWTDEPVPLFERFPRMTDTAVPRMLTDAYTSGLPQGPEVVEWYLPLPDGQVVRLDNEVTATRCGRHLLLSWVRGQRTHLAEAAQRLARVCWVEWNLGDGSASGSLSAQQVLGLPDEQAVPGLLGFAEMTDAVGRETLYQALYDLVLRGRRTACDLFLPAAERFLHLVAQPVRLPQGPVWSLPRC